MSISALIFGAIGTLAETSDLQRRAYNHAFAEADLDWVWDRDSYLRMLRAPGGRDRLARYAADAGDSVDTEALHAAKVRHFARLVESEGIKPRPGVLEVVRTSQRRGLKLAFATGTDAAQVDLILQNLVPGLGPSDFDWIGTAAKTAAPKPAPDLYEAALSALDVAPDAALAVEDTPESAEAALAAGIRTLAFPGIAAADREFQSGVMVVDRLQARILDLPSGARMAAE